jgi:hypothetical protein
MRYRSLCQRATRMSRFHQVVRMLGGMRVYQILTNLHELLKSMYQLTACESAK